MFENKTVLITGGTGSLGKALTACFLQSHPELQKLVIFSRDEQKQYHMMLEYPREEYPNLHFIIGDIRDRERVLEAFRGVDLVVHTAAMKHVHIAEHNPLECIKTNIHGAENVIWASREAGVQRVVALSTDKACAPSGIYGATKLAADKLFINAGSGQGTGTVNFSVIRYGNVMGSSGSIVPYFLEKRKSGVLPVTDPRMTRFNISSGEGVKMVMYALQNAWGGELYVPKIPSYRITDLAEAVCPECRQQTVGVRPGEKLHEELITETDAYNTYDLGKYYAILPMLPAWDLQDYVKTHRATKVPEDFSYNSGNNPEWETVQSLRKIIYEKTH